MQLSNVYINCTNLYIMQLKPQFTNTLWRVLWGVYLRRQDLTVAIHSQRPLDVLRGRVSQQPMVMHFLKIRTDSGKWRTN